ncbi:MAG: hypothetical protein Q8928_18775 [Bacteroidota bacterium]|nr:hypothetical protein [Bacteroidota bacterium]
MKKVLFFSVLIFAMTKVGYSQVKCDSLEAENKYLKKVIGLNQPIKVAEADKVEYKLVSCEGNKKAQTVTLEFLIINKQANSGFVLERLAIIDLNGNSFDAGYDNINTTVYTDVPLKGKQSFSGILPEVQYIKLFKFHTFLVQTKQHNDIEFRDIKISWK